MILENIDGPGCLNFRFSHEIRTIKVLRRNNKLYTGRKTHQNADTFILLKVGNVLDWSTILTSKLFIKTSFIYSKLFLT